MMSQYYASYSFMIGDQSGEWNPEYQASWQRCLLKTTDCNNVNWSNLVWC